MAHLLKTTDFGYVLKNVIGKTNSFSFFISNKSVIVEASNHLSKPSVPLLIAHFHQRLLEWKWKKKKENKKKIFEFSNMLCQDNKKNITIILVRYLLDMSDYSQCCVLKMCYIRAMISPLR